MTPKRKKVEEYINKVMLTIEPGGVNAQRYKDIFSKMSDVEFDKFMKDIRDKKRQLVVYAPNLKVVLQTSDLFKACDLTGAVVFEKLVIHDKTTGMEYTTPNEFPILRLPIRRLKQFQMHKMSVPEGDKKIDALTGQLVKPDASAKFSFPEMQVMHGKGLDNTIIEFMKLRGGDIYAYSTMLQSLEETGEFSQKSLPNDSIARSVMTMDLILKSMLIDNNFVDDNRKNLEEY